MLAIKYCFLIINSNFNLHKFAILITCDSDSNYVPLHKFKSIQVYNNTKVEVDGWNYQLKFVNW